MWYRPTTSSCRNNPAFLIFPPWIVACFGDAAWRPLYRPFWKEPLTWRAECGIFVQQFGQVIKSRAAPRPSISASTSIPPFGWLLQWPARPVEQTSETERNGHRGVRLDRSDGAPSRPPLIRIDSVMAKELGSIFCRSPWIAVRGKADARRDSFGPNGTSCNPTSF
jgi:hypothetical protein